MSLDFHRGRVSPRRKGHPSSHGLQVLYYSAVGPSAQARDTARHEEEDEHADPNLRKVTIKRSKKGLRSSTKMDFYESRNQSYLAQINVYLSWSSKEICMTSDVSHLSNTKSTYVGMQSCAKMMMWQACHLISC
jgi:hypothetical protein